jgi:hypothetical protein
VATAVVGQPAEVMAWRHLLASVLASQGSVASGVVGWKQLAGRSQKNPQSQVHRQLLVLPAVVEALQQQELARSPSHQMIHAAAPQVLAKVGSHRLVLAALVQQVLARAGLHRLVLAARSR